MGRWENLANAIIEQAVKDYMEKPSGPHVTEEEKELCTDDAIKDFFGSRWFGTLSTLDGEELFDKVVMMRRADEKKRLRAVRAAA